MKKFVLTSLSLALIGAAGAAHAQSSVTLYGLIDTGLTFSNNSGGERSYQQASGVVNGDRWGLRGTEDLGNGLKAVFVLESGFNLSNGKAGQNGRLFGRQAFVGLSGNQFGAVTLGRQYDSVVDYLGPLALNGTQYGGTLASHPFDNDNLNNSVRINNAVKFQSVDFGGFKFGALYGFSNAAGSFADSRAYSAGASYTFGGLTAAAAYLQLNAGGSATNPAGAVAAGDSTFNASRQRTYGGGLSYAFGAANVGFVFTQTQLNNASSIGSAASGQAAGFALNGDTARFTNYEVNGRYSLTPAWTVAGAYTFTDARLNGARPKYNQFTLQTDYALSKRTDVYAEAAYQHVHGTGNSGITADIVGMSASSTDTQVVGTVGIRHRF
jgi:GBP family porin